MANISKYVCVWGTVSRFCFKTMDFSNEGTTAEGAATFWAGSTLPTAQTADPLCLCRCAGKRNTTLLQIQPFPAMLNTGLHTAVLPKRRVS